MERVVTKQAVLILWESKRDIERVFVFAYPDEREQAIAQFKAYQQRKRMVTLVMASEPEPMTFQPNLIGDEL